MKNKNEVYTIQLARESPEGDYFIESPRGKEEIKPDKSWSLVRFFAKELMEIFPRKVSIEIYNLGYFSDWLDESIEMLEEFYKNSSSKYLESMSQNLKYIKNLEEERDFW